MGFICAEVVVLQKSSCYKTHNINIPITPYFFEKLDIYERCRKGDKLTTERFGWAIEELLLKNSISEANYVIPDLNQYEASELLKSKNIDSIEIMKGQLMMDKIFESLIANGFAVKKDENSIEFTEKGRKWGTILKDIEQKDTLKYTLTLTTIRLAFIMFLINMIISSAYEIGKIFSEISFGSIFLIIFFFIFSFTILYFNRT